MKDGRLGVSTRYVFEPGRITRTDVYTPRGAVPLSSIDLEFGAYSAAGAARGRAVRFGAGAVRSFTVTGLDGCSVEPVTADPYRTPVGPLASRVTCKAGTRVMTQPLTVSWTLTYAADRAAP